MKIYTKTGDQGETGLLGQKRLSKSHLRLQVIGEIDELNCHLGLLTALEISPEIKEFIINLQHLCFNLGAGLAGSTDLKIQPQQITKIEDSIDQLQNQVPPLKQFILPAGGINSAQCHLARAVCRRTERALVLLTKQENEPIPPQSLIFLNRLSDWLFVCARVLAQQAGQPELFWHK